MDAGVCAAADGWWLRQDIIWSKPNPMPESVTDRCTKAHEYLFLLTKSATYYCDMEAIKEDCSENTNPRRAGNGYKTPDGWDTSNGNGGHGTIHKEGREDGFTGYMPKGYKGSLPGRNGGPGQDRRGDGDRGRKLAEAGSGTKNNDSFDEATAVMPERRNKRSVWTIATQPYLEAHFATYPEALVEPCILAGTSELLTVRGAVGAVDPQNRWDDRQRLARSQCRCHRRPAMYGTGRQSRSQWMRAL
jgi:hypothetical protein